MNVLEKSAQTEAESRTRLIADYRACLARFETPQEGDEAIVRRAMAELKLTEDQVRTHATIVDQIRSAAAELAKGPAAAQRVTKAVEALRETLPALKDAREATKAARRELAEAQREMQSVIHQKGSLSALWASPVARLCLGDEMSDSATPEIDAALSLLRELETLERRVLGETPE